MANANPVEANPIIEQPTPEAAANNEPTPQALPVEPSHETENPPPENPPPENPTPENPPAESIEQPEP